MVMPLDEVYLERWKGSGLFIFRQFCSFMIRIQFRKDFRNFAGLGIRALQKMDAGRNSFGIKK